MVGTAPLGRASGGLRDPRCARRFLKFDFFVVCGQRFLIAIAVDMIA